MARRYGSYRRIKAHLPYNVDEAARAAGVHRNTVLAWTKTGLETVDGRKPFLFKGAVLVAYLKNNRTKNKQSCGPGRLFCLRCRVPQRPALGMAEVKAVNGALGDLMGICPVCETLMHRRVSLAKLGAVLGDLDVSDVSPTLALPHIVDTRETSVDCVLKPTGETDEKRVRHGGAFEACDEGEKP